MHIVKKECHIVHPLLNFAFWMMRITSLNLHLFDRNSVLCLQHGLLATVLILVNELKRFANDFMIWCMHHSWYFPPLLCVVSNDDNRFLSDTTTLGVVSTEPLPRTEGNINLSLCSSYIYCVVGHYFLCSTVMPLSSLLTKCLRSDSLQRLKHCRLVV